MYVIHHNLHKQRVDSFRSNADITKFDDIKLCYTQIYILNPSLKSTKMYFPSDLGNFSQKLMINQANQPKMHRSPKRERLSPPMSIMYKFINLEYPKSLQQNPVRHVQKGCQQVHKDPRRRLRLLCELLLQSLGVSRSL